VSDLAGETSAPKPVPPRSRIPLPLAFLALLVAGGAVYYSVSSFNQPVQTLPPLGVDRSKIGQHKGVPKASESVPAKSEPKDAHKPAEKSSD
jgi:hypothetical protein